MSNIWRKHPFPLLLYLEWVLLGIALLASVSFLIPHPRHHHLIVHSPWFNVAGFFCVVTLTLMGLRLPLNSKLSSQIYIFSGFIVSWLTILFVGRGERIFPALLLVVVIRACLLFSWSGRIIVAVMGLISFVAVQVMSFMKITPFGISLSRPLTHLLRRLPPEELRRVLFGLVFNSGLLFAFVLGFVLLLVGAVLAEHESRAKLMKAHHRLRQYAWQIENQATLQERNRIAREIHDSVGHYLTAQSIQLENAAVFLTQDLTKASHHLAKARQLGKEALINIRSSVATLRTKSEPKRSLKVRLAELITNFKSHTTMAIVSEINLISTLPLEVNTALYRIVQEALTNITKHSQANKVNLNIQQDLDRVSLSIRDNGCGFNKNDNTTGFGLQGMQERTAALNGKFKIKSEFGKGCQIIVEIPLSLIDS